MTGGFSKTGTNWRIALPVAEQPERVAEFLTNGKAFIARVIHSKKRWSFYKTYQTWILISIIVTSKDR